MFAERDGRLIFTLPTHESVANLVQKVDGSAGLRLANKSALFTLLKLARGKAVRSNPLSALVLMDMYRRNEYNVNLVAAQSISDEEYRVLDFSLFWEGEVAEFIQFAQDFGISVQEEEAYNVLSVGRAMGWSTAQSVLVVGRAHALGRVFGISPMAVLAATVCNMSYEKYPIGDYPMLNTNLSAGWHSRARKMYSQTKNAETPLFCATSLTDEQVLTVGEHRDVFLTFADFTINGLATNDAVSALVHGVDLDFMNEVVNGNDVARLVAA